jgi:hypothetical protein
MKINRKYIATIGILSAIAAVMVIPGNAFAANPNTSNPSGWGKLTSGAATTDGRAFGDHAANPPFEVTPDQPGRTGLANILQEVTNNDDASKHPSELGSFLCTNFPGTSPCP